MSGPKNATRRSRRVQPAEEPLRLLAITTHLEDRIALNRILKGQHWHVFLATSCAEAIELLTSQQIPIVVCDHKLPDGGWQDILNHSAQYREDPTLIVTSRLADDHLWVEVLNLGGYDVLSKPFDEHEVRRVIAGACLRKSRHVRTCLASH